MRGGRKASLCESLNSKITFCELVKRYAISMFKIFLFCYLIIFSCIFCLVGLIITVLVIDRIGRKYTILIEFFIFSVFTLFLNICTTRFVKMHSLYQNLYCLPINSKPRFIIFLILLRSHKLLIKKAYSDAILLSTVSIICGQLQKFSS